MCGLIGIVHKTENVSDSLFQGLKILQYRGYDSCGMCIVDESEFDVYKELGSVSNLEKYLKNMNGKIGIGHTRWATHGSRSIRNSQPFVYMNIALVHNGIIENHLEIKESSTDYEWKTETDTEVLLKMAYDYLQKFNNDWDLVLQKICETLEGSFAVSFLDLNDQNKIYFVRKGLSPISISVGKDYACVSSDCSALSGIADHVFDLEDGQYGYVAPNDIHVLPNFNNKKREIIKIDNNDRSQQTWYMSEFYSQPVVLMNVLKSINNFKWPEMDTPEYIHLLGCGSAYYASCVGKHWIEKIAKIPVNACIASEWVNNINSGLVGLVSQSGETADTIAALRRAKKDKKTIGFINSMGSAIAREVDYLIPTFAGHEISVASTKAMTGQMLSLFIWTSKLAGVDRTTELYDLFKEMNSFLEIIPKLAGPVSAACSNKDNLIILARGNLVPITKEASLKIKELAYIHSEGMSLSELKHGPLALVDSGKILIVMAPSSSPFWTKILSSIEEINTRGGKVVVLTDKPEIFTHLYMTVKMPYVEDDLAPFVYILPFQWLAYDLALSKGVSVDNPRNLAKSVTVE
ncbi:glutamine--fructose-6-phosphate transaminase (isomerizing) [Candidatus Nesciobacter abundans]|uniref:Glutamine--fructose-6-phosphate aminotransferase [isomerizing] n=1 Tax=Candidatus Nesciobacter abundans TaxID=2601668 RepID=A0A5C0UIE7_9PROT|nr:glutamine--fructose-6-phosphate transaminase (isomerizing) [Candidatus Nesciobacter abundans]QEK39283.1 glutamine--fructose-6-phosphate transaminase (isomerizing) [Candidatus Nesciobacter abundans]